MNVIILHNSEDKESRDFVASIPKDDGNTYCVIDWYKQPEEIKSRTCHCHFGQPYMGPDPSKFPEMVFMEMTPPDIKVQDAVKGEVAVKLGPQWSRIRDAKSVTDLQKPEKIDARKPVIDIPDIKVDLDIKP